MDVQTQSRPDLTRLAELIDGIEVAMLTTVERDGTLRSRPLKTLQIDSDGALWFMTSISSPKIAEIDEHRRVCLSYSRPGRETHVSVSGVTQILRDEAKARELWSVELLPWLPNGMDDPEVVLLKLVVEQAEVWEHKRWQALPLGARPPENEKIQPPRTE